jgi:carboxymethylenebutenolidase
MKARFALLLVILVALTTLCTASNSKSATKTEASKVTFSSGTEQVQGELFLPQGKGPFPAVIVIHEWYGLNDWVRQQAQKLAAEGYAALAVDLYRGKVAKDGDEAHELMRGLPEDRALRDMQAAVTYLQSRADVRKERIGAIGWCMGGGHALNLAVNEPRLKAVVINYGRLVTDPASLQKIHAAVLGIFGSKDRGISASDVYDFGMELQRQKKSVDITSYPEAGHGFQNENNPSYRADDAADAWKKIKKFFQRQLKE